MKTNFNMSTWCAELLSCERQPTAMSSIMVNYVLTGKIDQDMLGMGSYADLKKMADTAGLKYSELVLTAMRGLVMVPQEGALLVAVFRYIQATTGQELTKTHFVEFFSKGMFKGDDMIRIYNQQADDDGDVISGYDWSTFKQELH